MELPVKITAIIGGVALAITCMLVHTCRYVNDIPYKRQVSCIEAGYEYTINRQMNVITCTKGGTDGGTER